MKRILEYLAFSIVLAGVLSAFTTINVSNDVLNTIYTVAGVIFSVGMSIAIMPKTDKVTNDKIRVAIRASYLAVRNSFMYLFHTYFYYSLYLQLCKITEIRRRN